MAPRTAASKKNYRDEDNADEEKEDCMDELMNEMKKLSKEFGSMKKDMKKDMKDFEKTLEFNSGKLDDLMDKMSQMQRTMNEMKDKQEKMETENRELKKRVKDLETSNEDLEQYSRIRNLQLDGLPKANEEDLEEMVKEMGKKVGMIIKNEDIDAIHRIPTRSTTNVEPVIVQFTTRKMRDTLLKKTKETRINTTDIKISGPQKPIFINEHLAPKRKQLLMQAKVKKNDKNYKFLWTKGGKIFVRKSESSRVIPIRTLDDLELIQ
uniref:FP protein C-terminal domain-containing protein n=1 Tax=Cacopsylla melanoneura TaxID=428564 RepID=A0A8D9B304_9HEMI